MKTQNALLNQNIMLRRFAWAWTLLFGLSCVAIPVSALLFHGSSQTGFHALLDSTVLSVVRVTLQQAFYSVFFSGFFGMILGLWVGEFLVKYPQSWLQGILIAPYGVPTLVAAMAWIAWFGRSGILAQYGIETSIIYSLDGVILAHSFLNIPWVALLVSEARRQIPQESFEAAQTLGANRFYQWRWITWPQIRWAFLGACTQVFALCVMSFALVLVLGGGPPVQTLETLIYERLRYGTLDMTGAVACAFWELVITMIPWGLLLYFRRRQIAHFKKVPATLNRSSRVGISRVTIEAGLLWLLCALFIAPYFIILDRTVLQVFRDLEWRQQIFDSLGFSVGLAIACGFLTVATAVASIVTLTTFKGKQAGFVGTLLGLPNGISVLVLGLGFWIAYGQWIDPFDGGLTILLGVQATLFFPVAYRLLWPVAQGSQKEQIEIACTLGASPFQAFWYIEWPRWKAPLLSAFAGVAGASLGEVAAISLFYQEKLVPLPLLISRWMQQYRFDEAKGVGGLLLLLSMGLILSSVKVGKRILK
jgi:thiamine transport system permease protein